MITLATLPQATEQEVFDQVAIHLLTQNKQSMIIGTKTCSYRGSSGLKCAAGCLMSDEEYNKSFENKVWGKLALQGHVPTTHEDLIAELQDTHDSFSPLEWWTSLPRIAADHNLSTSAIDNFKN